jgi:hypothetical protein
VLRDIEIIKQELAVDILEFFFLTPLPGSEDHKTLAAKGVWMDPDMNKYDLNHIVTGHPKMSAQEWTDAYRGAWANFYTPEHIRTILRRAAQSEVGRPGTTLTTILWFKLMILFEGVHPLEGGALRLKYRRDRRSSMPREGILPFYAKYWGGTLAKLCKYLGVYLETRRTLKAVLSATDRRTYEDLAIAPVTDAGADDLALYQVTSGGAAALARQRQNDASRLRVAEKAGTA